MARGAGIYADHSEDGNGCEHHTLDAHPRPSHGDVDIGTNVDSHCVEARKNNVKQIFLNKTAQISGKHLP